MSEPIIPREEHAARRKRLRTAIPRSVGLVFAGESSAAHDAPFRPHPHFEYLTGLVDEPGAVLLLDPANPVEARQEILFLRPRDPELERWDGERLPLGKAIRDRVGMKTVLRTTGLPRVLTDSARRAGSVACLHPLANHEQPVSPDLAIFRRLAERIPGLSVTDQSDAIPAMRSIKSRHEVAMIERAVEITRIGFAATIAALRPGMTEFDVQETLEHAYRTNGSRRPAFGTIAGSGRNSTVLHYRANDAPLEDGDLICIDSGAAFGGYGADVTRTVPVGGRFTPRQREIYDVVHAALGAATRAVKPGVRIAELDTLARAVVTKAGLGDAFIHGIGHHLGLETHDAAPDAPLKAGAVITIEPGVYIPDEKIGVRIEDDVLVTRDGHRVLTAKIPRRAADVERK
jgi:Xaa-Pro aminopeptidase